MLLEEVGWCRDCCWLMFLKAKTAELVFTNRSLLLWPAIDGGVCKTEVLRRSGSTSSSLRAFVLTPVIPRRDEGAWESLEATSFSCGLIIELSYFSFTSPGGDCCSYSCYRLVCRSTFTFAPWYLRSGELWFLRLWL